MHFAHRLCTVTLNSNFTILKYWFFFSIWVKELLEPIVLRKKGRRVFALFKRIFVRNWFWSNARWFYGKKHKIGQGNLYLKVDMPILTCIFSTFNWLTLTSKMHFVKFYPEVASCLLSRGKRKYAPLGMSLLWKYIRNYFLVYQ